MPFAEARRILTLCQVCKYCNGYCDVFRAIESRRGFSAGDLGFLANLCHNCGNCWNACQYAPPHPFAVNVPKTMAELRDHSYADYSRWVKAAMALITMGMAALPAWDTLFAPHVGPGAFYAVIPWGTMCLAALCWLIWPVVSLCRGLLRFWRRCGGGNAGTVVVSALRDILTLRNLDGGGVGCDDGTGGAFRWRRWFHHAVVTGFALCLVSTVVATFYHHVLDWPAPYPRLSLPVLLGSVGGLGIMLGTVGLAWAKKTSDPRLAPQPRDYSLCLLLFSVAASGLALMVFRDSAAMGSLLTVHLGCVFAVFSTIAHGKAAHAPYRALALLRRAMEKAPPSIVTCPTSRRVPPTER